MPRRNGTGRILLLAAFLGCAAALGLLMLKKYEERDLAPQSPAQIRTEAVSPRRIILFFALPDGSGLARESREVDACDDLPGCIRMIITELIKGPLGDLEPTLPPAVLNGVAVANGTAVLDLGEGFTAGLPGGSSSEMAAVYSIVNSIAVNYPEITGVKFLINGRESPTLKGSLDLRSPLAPDFSLEHPAGGAVPGQKP